MCKPIDYNSFKDDPEYIDVVYFMTMTTIIENDMSRALGDTTNMKSVNMVWDTDIKLEEQHIIISILKDKNTNAVMFNMKSEKYYIKRAIKYFNSL